MKFTLIYAFFYDFSCIYQKKVITLHRQTLKADNEFDIMQIRRHNFIMKVLKIYKTQDVSIQLCENSDMTYRIIATYGNTYTNVYHHKHISDAQTEFSTLVRFFI